MAHRVPYMFPHTGLVDRDDARYVFTSFPHYGGETEMMYRYLARDRGMKRIAILYDPNAYGRFFRDRLRALGRRRWLCRGGGRTGEPDLAHGPDG